MGTRLAGKAAIVIGSGQGIGRAAAIAFAYEGAVVVIATRTAARGEETFRLIGSRRQQGDLSAGRYGRP
jgi:3-oxoacyl-[acyl-carrier protein] reductase